MAKIKVNFESVTDNSIPVDADTYSVLIKKADYKEGKTKGDFGFISAQFEITQGQNAGRMLFNNFTLDPTPTERGSAKNFMLYNLCKACGLAKTPADLDEVDTDDLINKEIAAIVEVVDTTDADGNEIKRNRIKTFKPLPN
jgi:hypothetical protein